MLASSCLLNSAANRSATLAHKFHSFKLDADAVAKAHAQFATSCTLKPSIYNSAARASIGYCRTCKWLAFANAQLAVTNSCALNSSTQCWHASACSVRNSGASEGTSIANAHAALAMS
eukprot:gnl/TRDRNA2_/TRDRNA2_146856_c1_seq2.p1 gnl/TRDRNA2_/TRDRNA2_146856_c1~~gnl/TRDRNA2_/TRDRNA2_146856_c1_seq2.p1  ORF type:complete len:118 (+),score=5.49 gnl/TRDRNA2_/TRDRNA2_146856_c1_seq2:104-457(+)